jgi:hypothetical protein
MNRLRQPLQIHLFDGLDPLHPSMQEAYPDQPPICKKGLPVRQTFGFASEYPPLKSSLCTFFIVTEIRGIYKQKNAFVRFYYKVRPSATNIPSEVRGYVGGQALPVIGSP